MKTNENIETDEKENENTLNKTDETSSQSNDVPAKRYRTRSSVSKTETLQNCSEVERKKRSATVPKPKPAFIEYKGKVDYYTDFNDIAFAADTLL